MGCVGLWCVGVLGQVEAQVLQLLQLGCMPLAGEGGLVDEPDDGPPLTLPMVVLMEVPAPEETHEAVADWNGGRGLAVGVQPDLQVPPREVPYGCDDRRTAILGILVLLGLSVPIHNERSEAKIRQAAPKRGIKCDGNVAALGGKGPLADPPAEGTDEGRVAHDVLPRGLRHPGGVLAEGHEDELLMHGLGR